MEKELTILMPCLNEESTIEICIKKAQRFLKERNIDGEVLVVDNGSKDKSKNIAQNCGARVIYVKQRGYGNAILGGIKNANGKYIIMGDSDDSYNFLEIFGFFKELVNGCDLVIGNRYYNMQKGAMKWSHKYIGTPILTHMINKKYKTNLHDINSGLRGLKKESIVNLNLQCGGMEFASEMIIKAQCANLKIKEIPINFYKDKRKGRGKAKLKTFRDGIKHLCIIMKEDNKKI